jgi:hypothetical protein
MLHRILMNWNTKVNIKTDIYQFLGKNYGKCQYGKTTNT